MFFWGGGAGGKRPGITSVFGSPALHRHEMARITSEFRRSAGRRAVLPVQQGGRQRVVGQDDRLDAGQRERRRLFVSPPPFSQPFCVLSLSFCTAFLSAVTAFSIRFHRLPLCVSHRLSPPNRTALPLPTRSASTRSPPPRPSPLRQSAASRRRWCAAFSGTRRHSVGTQRHSGGTGLGGARVGLGLIVDRFGRFAVRLEQFRVCPSSFSGHSAAGTQRRALRLGGRVGRCTRRSAVG